MTLPLNTPLVGLTTSKFHRLPLSLRLVQIEEIKKVLQDNGYSKNVINFQITKKIAQFFILKRFGPEKCPVYLRVPWIGKPSTNLEKEVKTAVGNCYGSVNTRLIFTSKRVLPVIRKDVLPTTQKSSVI